MSKEIEKKYVVSNPAISELPQLKVEDIAQGYLAIEPSGTEVRLRSKSNVNGSRYFLTVKCGEGLVRGEAETEITEEQFNVLWPMTGGRRVEKTRHTLALAGDLKAEVDFYRGNLQGLCTAEVEFPTEEAAQAFIPPSWFGDDVTSDKRFKNQKLAALTNAEGFRSKPGPAT